MLEDVASSSACYFQLSNIPVYASILTNEVVKEPLTPEKKVLTYWEANERDTDYEQPETDEDRVRDIIVYGSIIIVGFIVYLILAY